MTYDVLGPGGLDYLPCRYGSSRVLFRGPQRSLTAPYLAFLGGTETYGKFIRSPFPALVETDLGINCVNFGVQNAGVDVFAADPAVLEAASNAEVTVIQILGAQNMSNRYYSVHPRRNDRFVTASTLLRTIYDDVDFAEFHFTRHMLSELYSVSEDRFATIRSELQATWVARMRVMLRQIAGKIVLLWVADHAPTDHDVIGLDPVKAGNPLFITRQMIDELAPLVSDVVEVVASPVALANGFNGLVFAEMEAPAAAETLGPMVHREAAVALSDTLLGMI
ncbi:DUF6473 family protein [Sulfitobacter sabulilitoris]|uniref:DUF6473 domain-containing protein n=1 Tax=Sulfitobacter sabulilitoris TaxID=2562655 RepID=A0A5S3PG00_9RHOB|nr:DUF6473 family protein [Sulfitobacter sabulilitoris]TMM53000.1 hypothetical protein FDT80_12220 [Sulfitobacter sabulilitoris]